MLSIHMDHSTAGEHINKGGELRHRATLFELFSDPGDGSSLGHSSGEEVDFGMIYFGDKVNKNIHINKNK